MNEAQKKTIRLWVDGLRSGIFTPIKRSREFYDGKNDRCGCGVGVLGKILNVEKDVLNFICGYDYRGDAVTRMRGQVVLVKTGIPKRVFNDISDGYEQGMTFSEIAGFLETKYLSDYANREEAAPVRSE